MTRGRDVLDFEVVRTDVTGDTLARYVDVAATHALRMLLERLRESRG